MDVQGSRIYPGIPEYFDPRGRGMYPYLTGAGSWLMLCFITMVWGIRGEGGNLRLRPQLADELFDREGRAQIRCFFAGRPLQVIYQRPAEARGDRWRVKQARLNGRRWGDAIPRDALLEAPEAVIYVELEGE